MQMRRFLRATSAALAVGAVAPPLAHAQLGVQKQRNVPSAYAITNARIVPVSGPAIERGTIVIRNGLIAAVGASVAVPADARTIDGSGLTVYPGWIDAFSTLGYQTAQGGRRDSAGGAGRAGGPGAPFGVGGAGSSPAPDVAPNSLHPAGLQPEVTALALLKDDADYGAAQAAGFAAALTAPATGYFVGQSAVISLRNGDVQDIMIKSPVAMHVAFQGGRGGGGGGYPGSLMGVFAALRQMLLDAQRYGQLQAAYAANPRGMARPENDPSLAALQPVLAGKTPVVLAANSQREIERALNLAKEFKLRAIIAGGQEAHLVAGRLKSENVPVLLSVDFPRRPAAASPDADPEPLRVLRERVEAPKSPAALAQAGVKFAFEPGANGFDQFLGNVQRAVESGLAKDAALRAMTITPAELFGVADRLGTIEVGKIASLTITRGDMFDRNARVAQLFVDGRPVDLPTPTPGGAAATAAGTWTVTVTLDGADKAVTLALQQDGSSLRGTLQGALGTTQIANGSLGADGELKFTASVTLASATEEATFTGNLSGNGMRGTVQIVGHPAGTFVGTRPNAGGGAGRGGRGARPPAR